MPVYCSDTDLLKWEPALFRDATFAAQLLISGSGSLAGSTFTIGGGSFNEAGVVAGDVLTLDGAIAGNFPVVSVDSDTQLTISTLGLRYDLGLASPVGNGSGLGYSVRNFHAQRAIASAMADVAIDLRAGQVVIHPQSLARPTTLAALQMIYSAVATLAAEPDNFRIRAALYDRLFRRALRYARVEIDTNGDGLADTIRWPRVLEPRRV